MLKNLETQNAIVNSESNTPACPDLTKIDTRHFSAFFLSQRIKAFMKHERWLSS